MRILHYIPTLSRKDGGTSTYMQQLAAELGRLVELHVVTHRTDDELPVENATVHYLRLTWRYWQVRDEYLRIIEEVKPDVVHVNCCWHPYFGYAVIWARRAGCRVVLSPHGMLEPWIMKRHYWTRKVPSLLLYQRRAVREAALLHATAEQEREHLLQLGWNQNVRVIANGIDVKQIGVKTDWRPSRRVLFLSRIHPKKGIEYLLEAFAAMPSDYVLQIAGEGEEAYVGGLRRLSHDLGIEARVEWQGGVYGPRKWELLRQADLFVLPTHSENFGIVVAEALASGTPVITTQGTPWEVLQTERCGWWIEVGTEPLAHALQQFVATSEAELRTMGLRGRRVVEERFATDAVVQQFVEMYRML